MRRYDDRDRISASDIAMLLAALVILLIIVSELR